MIEIINIWAGWLTFQIHYGDLTHQFTVSYLDDFKEEINYLLGINNNGEHSEYLYNYKYGVESRAITLDGEGTLLKLSILKTEYEDYLTLVWWLNDEVPVCMVFDYSSFVKSYIKEMDRIGEETYKKDFLMDYERENNNVYKM